MKNNYASSDDLELLINNHSNLMVISDLNGVILAINDKLAVILGKPKNQLIGSSGFNYIGKHVIEPRKESIKEAIKTKKPVDFEDEDKGRWWKTEIKPIIDENGDVVKLAIYVEDITEKKTTEKNYLNLDKQMTFLNDNIADVIMQVTLSGKITYINPTCERIYGYKQNEVIGKRFTKFAAIREIPRYFSKIQEMKSGKRITNFETKVIHKNGNILPVEFSGQMVVHKNKKYIHAVMRDISERKNAEKKLRESEEKFRMLSEQSLMGVGIIQGGQIKYANNAIKLISGYSKRETLSEGVKILSKIIHPDDFLFVQNQLQKKLVGEKNVQNRYSFRIITKTGEIKWVEIFSKTIKYEGENADFVTFVDITNLKVTERELERGKDHLQRIIDSTSDLVISLDKNFNVTAWNATVEYITGWKKNKIFGKNPFSRDIFEDDEKLISNINDIFDGNNPKFDNIVLKNKTGEKHYIKINTNLIKNETDEIVGVLMIGKDITSEVNKQGRLNPGFSYLVSDKNKTVLHELTESLIHENKAVLMISRGTSIENGEYLDYSEVKNLEKLVLKIETFSKENNEPIILLDRVDYLITKYSFGELMETAFKLNDTVERHNSNLIMRINPDYLEKEQYTLLQEEFKTLPIQSLDNIALDENQFNILKYIYGRNQLNENITYTKVSKKFSISRVTNSKRIEELKKMDLINVKQIGKYKYITITDKGERLIRKNVLNK